jgi:hypothetical protein
MPEAGYFIKKRGLLSSQFPKLKIQNQVALFVWPLVQGSWYHDRREREGGGHIVGGRKEARACFSLCTLRLGLTPLPTAQYSPSAGPAEVLC